MQSYQFTYVRTVLLTSIASTPVKCSSSTSASCCCSSQLFDETVGATEGAGVTAGAAERVRSGAEVRIGIATAAVGVGVLHASIGAGAAAVGGGALRLGSAKLELYPQQGVVGAGGGAGTGTGVYFAFSAGESFVHIWPKVFSLSAL